MKQQVAITNLTIPKHGNARANQIMALASGICLAALFYLNGSFNMSGFPLPEPQNEPSMASGGAGYKTTATTSVSTITTKALAFKALLSTTQQATLEQSYTTTLARKWSNLPCGASCRNGIEFGTLTATQLTAALDVIKEALGTTTNNGYDEFYKNYIAEAYLHANGGGSGYDSTLRWICFLNTPTSTGAWMLQFGGHHYAANIAFNNGHVIGATPFFQGLEPKSFTWNSATYAPLDDEKNAFQAMLGSLSSTELNSATLSASFSDCVMIPGETNGGTSAFPAYTLGLSCASLTSAQKNLVQAAIATYVEDVDATTAAAITAAYTADIDNTYISWRGTGTAGTANSFLTTNGDYVRISGPAVWIEFTCQNGVVISGQIHYHTVWRDRVHDYGVDLTGPAIDGGSTANVADATKSKVINVYPNPANDQLTISLNNTISEGNIMVMNMTGQVIKILKNQNGTSMQLNISDLPAGNYVVKIQDKSGISTGKFSKL